MCRISERCLIRDRASTRGRLRVSAVEIPLLSTFFFTYPVRRVARRRGPFNLSRRLRFLLVPTFCPSRSPFFRGSAPLQRERPVLEKPPGGEFDWGGTSVKW